MLGFLQQKAPFRGGKGKQSENSVARGLLHLEAQAEALILEDKKEEEQALLG